MNPTPEVIEALAYLRNWTLIHPNLKEAFDVLDNAGVFKEIDDATGHDVTGSCTCPPDERARSGTDNHYIECPKAPVSKCTCSAAMAHHLNGCPGDPAEWGDLASTTR